MRWAVSSSRRIAALLIFLLPSIVWGQHFPVPGPAPIFPAPASPRLSPLAPESFDPPPPRGYPDDMSQGKQEAAWVGGLPPGYIQSDAVAIAEVRRTRPLGRFVIQQESQPRPDAPSLVISFNGISYTGSFPPDPVLAAGPGNLVLVTNGSVTIRNKTGTLVASTSLEAFFGSVRASGENAFDPRVVFDTGSNRFFVSATGRINVPSCTAGNCVSHFFLGVSKSSSPTTTGSGDWYFYGFDATLNGSTPTTNWADFPGLGVDGSAVVLTANMFSFSSGSFQTAKIRVFDKSVLVTGGGVTWTDFVGMTDPSTGFLSATLQPALTFGNPGTFFLVSRSRSSGSCNIVVWGIENALSSPTLSSKLATAGGTCATPTDAEQLGGGTPLDTGDARLYNSVYRNNSLWTAQAINMNFGSGNVSAIRWVEIDVAGWPSSVSFVQDATFGADGIWYFYPTVMVDVSGNLAIALSRSSAAQYASAYYTGRQGAEASNTLQPSELLKAGAANYTLLDSGGQNRWGDYLGIGLDPSDGSFWVLGEYAASSSSWGTWVGNFFFTNPVATLASLAPSSSTAGGTGFTLTVNGSSFLESSVARWNGSDRSTTFVNSTQLQASIPSSDIATAGTAQVTVFNPSPGGGASNALTFTINNPVPAASLLSPSSATAGRGSFTLTVSGANFVSSSVVRWNGSDRATTFVNSTQLQASIPSSDIATAGTAQVTVFNPSPGGGTSSARTFTINESFTLTLIKAGSGDGTVTSGPSGIACGSSCSTTFDRDSSVILSAGADSGSTFSAWSGGGCSGTGTCTVTMNGNATVKATLSKAFTDDPLTAQVSPVKAAHITELRQAINTLRANNSLSAFSFTDPSLIAGTSQVKSVHVTELRAALNGVYDALGRARPTYTDSTVAAGETVVKKAHIAEIRSAVRGVE